nr:MAG TPA: hypothetical protein [Caudoviricetes sp.]
MNWWQFKKGNYPVMHINITTYQQHRYRSY